MPLIKDKDRYKKLSSRDRGRARLSESSNLPNKSINISKRNNQESTEKKKTEDILEASNNDSNLTSIQSVHVDATILTQIFKLSKGQTLKKLLIASGEAASVFDLHWSFKPQNDLKLTIPSAGRIVETNNESTRLFRRSLEIYASIEGTAVSGSHNNAHNNFDIKDLFTNVSTDIYFYFYASRNAHITYLIT